MEKRFYRIAVVAVICALANNGLMADAQKAVALAADAQTNTLAKADAQVRVPPAPFELPPGAKVLAQDDSGKTWRQNGVVTGAVQTVQAAFSNQLVKAKFRCKHVIPLEEKTGRVLEEWRKGELSLLLMLWPGEKGMTMFSWGDFE